MTMDKIMKRSQKLDGFERHLRERELSLPYCLRALLVGADRHIGINLELGVGAYAINMRTPSLDDVCGEISLVGVFDHGKYGELIFTSAEPYGGKENGYFTEDRLRISEEEGYLIVSALTSVADSPVKRNDYPVEIRFPKTSIDYLGIMPDQGLPQPELLTRRKEE